MLRGHSRKPAAVFKPIDEEQFAPNNPRDFRGPFGSSTFRPGIVSGESTIREIAAYLLDHEHFSGVPTTYMVSIDHDSFRLTDSALKGFPPILDSASCSSVNSSELASQSIFAQVTQLLGLDTISAQVLPTAPSDQIDLKIPMHTPGLHKAEAGGSSLELGSPNSTITRAETELLSSVSIMGSSPALGSQN